MNERTYIRVFWHHESTSDPVELWSELDIDRFETRKLEYYRDGTVGYASEAEEANSTRLGELAVPTLSEINSDHEFRALEATQAEFESRWQERHKGQP